jgi:hypothetical protein
MYTSKQAANHRWSKHRITSSSWSWSWSWSWSIPSNNPWMKKFITNIQTWQHARIQYRCSIEMESEMFGFVNWSSLNLKFWIVELLNCWFVDLLICWFVDFNFVSVLLFVYLVQLFVVLFVLEWLWSALNDSQMPFCQLVKIRINLSIFESIFEAIFESIQHSIGDTFSQCVQLCFHNVEIYLFVCRCRCSSSSCSCVYCLVFSCSDVFDVFSAEQFVWHVLQYICFSISADCVFRVCFSRWVCPFFAVFPVDVVVRLPANGRLGSLGSRPASVGIVTSWSLSAKTSTKTSTKHRQQQRKHQNGAENEHWKRW